MVPDSSLSPEAKACQLRFFEINYYMMLVDTTLEEKSIHSSALNDIDMLNKSNDLN